jgi:hypothetical protein
VVRRSSTFSLGLHDISRFADGNVLYCPTESKQVQLLVVCLESRGQLDEVQNAQVTIGSMHKVSSKESKDTWKGSASSYMMHLYQYLDDSSKV